MQAEIETTMPEARGWNTLIDVMRHRAEHQPADTAFSYLDKGETEAGRLTYQQFATRACAIGAQLQQALPPGSRALLLYPAGLEFVTAFFGCQCAGVIAVPAYPPDPTRLTRTLPRLQNIANDAQTTAVLTTRAIMPVAQALFPMAPELREMQWIATDAIDDASAEQWRPPALNGESLSFLQYTSGSTSTPKGVMVSHSNLLHNLKMIRAAFQLHRCERVVSWLPLYHDMGLIGHVIEPLYIGRQALLMSPIAFLKRPFCWLQAISRHRATTSTAPNFAYDLCVRKVTEEQKRKLDLSCWQQALNGAEPVRPETLDAFAEAFASCGFRREAFFPCYGLAEATLVVSGGKSTPQPAQLQVESGGLVRNEVWHADPALSRADRSALDVRHLTSSGLNPVTDQQIAIVDPSTGRRCVPGSVGEIWISGPSVAAGYWGRPNESEETFRAGIDGEPGPSWLRSGDLGFIQSGQLYVTGRVKDIVIVRGQNYYPQDIEWIVESTHALLRPGSSAAFCIEHEGESLLAVVAEVARDFAAAGIEVEKLVEDVRREVMARIGVFVHAVALIKAGTACKTSSGKIQRRASREAFRSGALDLHGTSIIWEKRGDRMSRLLQGPVASLEAPDPIGDLVPYLQPQPGVSPAV